MELPGTEHSKYRKMEGKAKAAMLSGVLETVKEPVVTRVELTSD